MIPSGDGPDHITPGPDGALWFTENPNKIGRITLNGAITEHTLSTVEPLPKGIPLGPDGEMWFTELANNKVGLSPTDGNATITESAALPTIGSNPWGIAVGS